MKKVLSKIGDPEGTMTSQTEQEIRHLEGKIADLEKKFDRLYDDRLEGILSERKFRELSAKCEAEQDIAAAQLAELKTKLAEQEGQERDIHRFVRLAEEYGEVAELDADMLNHLVNRIVVGERVKDGDTVTQKIKVEYKFIGVL